MPDASHNDIDRLVKNTQNNYLIFVDSNQITRIPPFLLGSIIPVTVAFAALSFNSQNRNPPTPERRGKRVSKVVPFLVPFWSQLWPKNGPQNGPKISPNGDNFGAHFWIPFCWVLELFGSLLGAFLGLLRLSWEAFGPQKP